MLLPHPRARSLSSAHGADRAVADEVWRELHRHSLDIDGQRVTISGIIDLVHVTSDAVEIIDYKTDRGRHTESEYHKQLSVYYQVASSQYPDRDVSISIFYTDTGQRVSLEPLSMTELAAFAQETECTQ